MRTENHSDALTSIDRPGEMATKPGQPVTPELVDHYLRRGYQLRSKAVSQMSRQLSRRVGAFFQRPRRPGKQEKTAVKDPHGDLADSLISPLSAIRSSAEILRDNPGIGSQEHQKYLEIVLAEEARLESLLVGMLRASGHKRRGRVWQVPLDKVKLGSGIASP